jgi:TRAP-type C4-dicarboxylate transport system permease small subunit
MFQRYANNCYQILMSGSCVAMVMAFFTIGLGVIAREAAWDIQGLDAYAGYSIAASLFLALPATFKRGEHIRVTLLMQRISTKAQRWLEHWCLGAGFALALYVTFFSCRLVWVSYTTHDVSQGADATPLWIPQIFMTIGCAGFALALVDAWWSHIKGIPFFEIADGEAARVE